MRYALFSDVHSNLEALDSVLGALKSEIIDKYLCVGDIVGYAANPNECLTRIKSLAQAVVAGNHDWASVGLLPKEYFNEYAKDALIWTEEKLTESGRDFLKTFGLMHKEADFTLAHGTLDKPEEFNYMYDAYAASFSFGILDTRLCFVGHTHISGIFIKNKADEISYTRKTELDLEEENRYIVNIGSVGQPRDGNPDASFCIYDSEKRKIYIKRASYDCYRARQKIIIAGLPEYLGNRLLAGR